MYKNRKIIIRNTDMQILVTYLRASDIRDVITTLQQNKEKRTNAWEIIGIMEPEPEEDFEEPFIKDYH